MPLRASALLLLCACTAAAGPSGPAGSDGSAPLGASSDTLRLVRYFLDTPTGDLRPELIEHFLDIEAAALPERLRAPTRAKKEELRALRRLAQGKSKPPLRRLGLEPGESKCPPLAGDERLVAWLRKLGFDPVTEDEKDFLVGKTRCSECELQEEFSLTVVELPPRKGKPAERRLFLHVKDPLSAYVGLYRKGETKTSGTGFFGLGAGPACR